ncbi:hypothetical protein F6455_14370 [Proteobacteria bacterium 005FR1]|nr:hypothetical protein [Proteobacteria bacterium 005FR1]
MDKQKKGRVEQLDAKAIQMTMLGLYDDFAELQDQCSFLCDAFTSIGRLSESVDQETLRGAAMYADGIKEKVSRMKADLQCAVEEVSSLITLYSPTPSDGH